MSIINHYINNLSSSSSHEDDDADATDSSSLSVSQRDYYTRATKLIVKSTLVSSSNNPWEKHCIPNAA